MDPSILVPYDGSEEAQLALTYASETYPDEIITALHVIEPISAIAEEDQRTQERYEEKYENASTLLTEAQQVVDNNPVEITTEFIYGHPTHAILRYASLYTFEQIVLGSDNQAADGDALGNVTEAVVRRANLPVTVVRSDTDDTQISSPESVLVPFDGSFPARDALEYAIETFPDATVHVLYVRYPFIDDIDQPGVRSSHYSDFKEWYEAVRDWHSQADRNPEHILQIADSVANDADTEIQSAVESGNPSRSILNYIDQIGADHVTIGSHSRDGGTRILLGSVAQLIARRATTPVTIVR